MSVRACAPNREVQQLLGSGGFQVLDGADPVQALLQEELSGFHRTRTTTRVHQVQTVARQLKDRIIETMSPLQQQWVPLRVGGGVSMVTQTRSILYLYKQIQ